MTELLGYLQDTVAVAFVALGVVIALTWLRSRERSLGFLALAIILLALEAGLGRLQAHLPFKIPLLTDFDLLLFMGVAYALVLYRAALIPLPRRWHAAVIASLAAASVSLLFILAVPTSKTVQLVVVVGAILVWCACVGEPIVRFWLAARTLPAVQAWRLRSLSLGFGVLVVALLLAISVGLVARQAVVQVLLELLVLAIVPLLYASFSPPAWLRRQWRAQEEESIRSFMEELLVSDDRDALAKRALELATRLVGGASAVLVDAAGRPTTILGLDSAQVEELESQLPHLHQGVSRITLAGTEGSAMTVPIKRLTESGTIVVLAGPFSPGFGGEEMTRMQQLMSAFVTALDRRHLILQLEESNRALIDANKHKSVFLANMSHELRTPLNAIIGFSELLTDARDGQFDDGTRKRFLNQIVTSGKHLLSLINDILDLSKVEAGQMELRLQPVSIPDSVDQVVKTIEPLVAKKNLVLETNVRDAGELLADAGKVKQMLLNLVSNAIKFTPEGGTVTITALRVKGTVEISVADTGIGIAEDDQKQIFQEFHQVDQGPGRKHEGTGLG
ncbi:MAG TPA: histidine kinase dimerization/phospho-acceptor domain-containing protein, partial [Candidatus Dormibacteraeota bacterium]|nr:histidine kinase dimerization/phospho-acceptor domain-containing protein [Candidatus Dormibacteraeota bacterium]